MSIQGVEVKRELRQVIAVFKENNLEEEIKGLMYRYNANLLDKLYKEKVKWQLDFTIADDRHTYEHYIDDLEKTIGEIKKRVYRMKFNSISSENVLKCISEVSLKDFIKEAKQILDDKVGKDVHNIDNLMEWIG